MGFAIAVAIDDATALLRYKEARFDLVLVDIDMKPMDGISLLRHLKQEDPNVVVVMMTAYSSNQRAVQSLKLGAFDYLEKPFEIKELITTIRYEVEFKKSQAERTKLKNKITLNTK